jgi:nitrogenase molybdenum-iron protein alpha/beta subunit
MNSIENINQSMYKASTHLIEAAKYLSDTGFKDESISLMSLADKLLDVIVPEPEKITEEKMNNIMDEIINYGN